MDYWPDLVRLRPEARSFSHPSQLGSPPGRVALQYVRAGPPLKSRSRLVRDVYVTPLLTHGEIPVDIGFTTFKFPIINTLNGDNQLFCARPPKRRAVGHFPDGENFYHVHLWLVCESETDEGFEGRKHHSSARTVIHDRNSFCRWREQRFLNDERTLAAGSDQLSARQRKSAEKRSNCNRARHTHILGS